jgi:putative PIG3 family NAD(P)H quinone oxidoreductase
LNKIPETMTAIAISTYGGPEMLVPEIRPVPSLDDGEILVRVHAAGVNRPDIVQRLGKYPPPPGTTDIPGLEFAGEVVALGAGATRHAVGDRVVALVAGGAYAEYCKVHETNALPAPKNLSMVEAAAIPETFFTVWSNLFERGRLAAGETALVHGGASGIGTTAIQLAKAFGAKMFVTAGSAEKCAACEKLGADLAINYRDEDFVARVKEATAGKGVDVILDMVGGDYVGRNYNAVADDGRIVQIAFMKGAKAEVDLWKLQSKRITHTGSSLRARSVAFKAKIAETLHRQVWPLIEDGKIAPVIDSAFPLAKAAEAHKRMEASSHFGKIVLTVAN